jgi:polyhydroxyalkanoate synthesis regulator phasin
METGMVLDGLRAYLQLATGLTEVTRERASAAAKALIAQGEASAEALVPGARAQVTSLTDDLLAASKANRHLLVNLVRTEVERSVARLGLVSAHEVDAASRRAKALERRVEELEAELSTTRGARKAAKKSAAKKSTAKKSTAKKAAKKSTADTTTAKQTTA